uniref:Uncharacterized protein n=1 Tax=Helianthus annuus TaxID=4232 RepID=A0A251VQR1_HELAN
MIVSDVSAETSVGSPQSTGAPDKEEVAGDVEAEVERTISVGAKLGVELFRFDAQVRNVVQDQ